MGEHAMSVGRGQLLRRLAQAWEAFQQSYAGLAEAELLEPGVTGAWSIKDVIAHVTWWEEEALTHLPLILAGGRPPRYSVTYGGIAAFNARMTEQDRKSTRLNSSHLVISYAVFCLKKKKKNMKLTDEAIESKKDK